MLIQFLTAVHALVVTVFAVRILLRNDLTSAARLAWFMLLLLAPYIGAVIYLLFGEISLGRTVHRRHDAVFDWLRRAAGPTMGGDRPLADIEPHYHAAFLAASVDGFKTTAGNRAVLQPDAMRARDALVEDLDAATDSIEVLYYIWLNDPTGVRVAEALIRAAGRGVGCRVMADGLGSRAFIRSPWWGRMEAAGVKVRVALPIRGLIRTILFSRIDLRNHRKITVIDHRVAWCGSQNCADSEFRVKAKYAPWVDIMLRFEGPVAAQCESLFASDWLLNGGPTLPDTAAPPLRREAEPLDHGFPAQLFADGPTDRRGATPQLFATLLTLATEEAVISTPYFVPNPTVLDALCGAALRGVKVTLILPQRNDSWIVSAASRSYYHQLLDHGVNIAEYRPGLLHAKTLTVDRKLTLVGSTNLDLRSFDLNYESDILLRDDATTAAVRERQAAYLAESTAVTLAEVDAWSIPRRLWNNIIATVGPVL